MITKWKFW